MNLFDILVKKKNDFKMPDMPKVSMKYMIPEENPMTISNIKNFFDRKKIKQDEEEKEKDQQRIKEQFIKENTEVPLEDNIIVASWINDHFSA